MAKTRLEDPDRLNKPGLVHFFRSFSAKSHDAECSGVACMGVCIGTR